MEKVGAQKATKDGTQTAEAPADGTQTAEAPADGTQTAEAEPQVVTIFTRRQLSGVELVNIHTRLKYLGGRLGVTFELVPEGGSADE